MLENLVKLSKDAAARSDALASEVPLRAASAIHLDAWNETSCDYGTQHTIAALFDEQVARTPDATALIAGDDQISYRVLASQVGRLAATLHEAGVGPNAFVGICVERGIDILVALLGVLRAGGTYLFLDPAYPRLRLQNILEDIRPLVLVIQHHIEPFKGFEGQIVILEDASDAIDLEVELPTCEATLDDILMVVYTSSSTGRAKGVAVPQSAVLNRLHWMWNEYPFQDGDVAILHKSPALVASAWESFGALLKGIPTVVISRYDQIDPALFFDRLTKNGVTYLLGTPSLLRGILDQIERHPGVWDGVRLGTTSAEPIEPELVRRWHTLLPDAPLLNLYGATECSSNASVYDTGALPVDATRVPIGRPLDNVRIHVLDDHGKPVPQGVAGEMCVSGACLAKGYVGLPKLTAERFVPNPFQGDPGRVLYHTGDIARMLSDGNLELLGRRDLQVKVRGFRVNLEDVESVLIAHEAVEQCAVARRGAKGRETLVAYVVAPTAPSVPELRSHLRERLPDYMLPATFAYLEALPRTPNGKLARQLLPEINEESRETSADYAAPRSDFEIRLADIFARTLELSKIGIHDDFFELGGHSLLAVQLVDKIEETFNVRVSIPDFFENATVEALTERLCGNEELVQSATVTLRSGEGRPLFCLCGYCALPRTRQLPARDAPSVRDLHPGRTRRDTGQRSVWGHARLP